MNSNDQRGHREARSGPDETPNEATERSRPVGFPDQAWEVLIAEMRPSLVRLAWAVCRDWAAADDAVQEALRVLAERGGEVPVGHRRGWLVRAVQLQAQNQRRKVRRSRAESDAWLTEWIAGSDRQPVDSLVREEEVQAVREALERLPPDQLRVVQMRVREGKTFARIAQELRVPLGTVLSRMRLAMERLKRDLEGRSGGR